MVNLSHGLTMVAIVDLKLITQARQTCVSKGPPASASAS